MSILRIHFTVNLDFRNPDFIWPASEATEWTLIEVNVAIVCGMASPPLPFHMPSWSCITSLTSISACLPSLKPIMTLALRGRVHNTQSANSQGPQRSSGKSSSAFDSIRKSSRTFRSTHSIEEPPIAPFRTSTSIANDTQPFARAAENERDADEDTEMAEMVSRSSRADIDGCVNSESHVAGETENARPKLEDGDPSDIA